MIVRESISFQRYKDPKTALGLKLHFIYNIEYDPENEGFSWEQNDEAIKNFIKKCIPEISDNEIERFMTFSVDNIINDIIPSRYFRDKDEEEIEYLLKANIEAESFYWMKINSDKVMQGIAKNSGINI